VLIFSVAGRNVAPLVGQQQLMKQQQMNLLSRCREDTHA
jgi:hypothetical protein